MDLLQPYTHGSHASTPYPAHRAKALTFRTSVDLQWAPDHKSFSHTSPTKVFKTSPISSVGGYIPMHVCFGGSSSNRFLCAIPEQILGPSVALSRKNVGCQTRSASCRVGLSKAPCEISLRFRNLSHRRGDRRSDCAEMFFNLQRQYRSKAPRGYCPKIPDC